MSEDNIAVAIRVRPVIKTEQKKKLKEEWSISGNEIYLTETGFRETETFTFDYILDTSSTNNDLYLIVQPLVHSTLNGFNATIFAYGQTSSGKTHSILGGETDPGIIPRAAQDIFSLIDANNMLKYMVRVSYVEIYNERIHDLLDKNNQDLKMQVSEDGKGHVLVGMHEEIVHNEDEMLAVIQKGNKIRQIGETKMNERSSRSHVICDILIESSSLEECQGGEVCQDTPVKAGHLYIVDLAGSERISQTGATGVRLSEGVHINKSLSTLISVITQLSNGASFVSYRDSKLTRLLSNALGGNSRTLIVAAITPVSVEDSLSTLKFARSAKTIKTKPRLNEIMNQQSIIKRQQSREKELLLDLIEKASIINKLQTELEESRKIYVPLKEYTKPKPARRHTMGAPPAIRTMPTMEPIMEQSLNEEEELKMNLNHFVAGRHSDGGCDKETRNDNEKNEINSNNDLNIIEESKYHDLMTHYNHLDQSHASLKEFTKLELEIQLHDKINEETAQLRQEIDTLLKENLKYQSENNRLKQSYEMLDVSHINLREFTKIEMDLAVDERTQQLQKEVDELRKLQLQNNLQDEHDKLKERLLIMEAEQEFLQNGQNQQLQRRCNELLARIEEFESQKTDSVQSIISEDVGILQEKCEKLEASIKLAEMHSKMLLDENNALKGYKKDLIRSISDTDLSAIGERCQDEDLTKEDFKRIFKSLRRLTSTIISGSDVGTPSVGTLTPMKTTPMSPFLQLPLGRIRTKSEKPSFCDRMSAGLQEEENEDLKKENAALKEQSNELLAKLKALNDKLNSLDITKLQQENEELTRKLQEQEHEQDLTPSCSNEATKTPTPQNLRELEDKIKQLEKDLQECEVSLQDHHNSKVKIEEMQEKLAEKEEQGNESMKELNILRLEHQLLVDKVKLLEEIRSNEHQHEQGEQQIEELRQQVLKLENELKQKQHDHEMDKEALEYSSTELDEAMAKIKELQTQLKVLIEEHKHELAKSKDELKLKIGEYDDCQSRLEMSQTENLEISTKLKALQDDYDMLTRSKEENNIECLKFQSLLTQKEEKRCELQQKLDETNELLHQNKMAADDAQQNSEKERESRQHYIHELTNELEAYKEYQLELQQSQDALKLKLDEYNQCKVRLEVSQAEILDNSTKLKALQDDYDELTRSKEEKIDECLKFQLLLGQKEEKLCELQLTLDETTELLHQNKMAAEDYKIELINAKELLLENNTSLQQSQDELKLKIDEYNECKVRLELSQTENLVISTKLKALQEDYDTLLAQKEEELCELQQKLDETTELLHRNKMAADVALQSAQDESERRQLDIHKLTGELTELQGKFDRLNAIQDEGNEGFAKLTASLEEKESEIIALHVELDESKKLLLKIENNEELAKLEAAIAEKTININELQAQLEGSKHECHLYKMAAEEKEILESKMEELNVQINQLQKQISVEQSQKYDKNEELAGIQADLQHKITEVGHLRGEIDSLKAELLKTKDNNEHDKEKLAKDSLEVKSRLENDLQTSLLKLKSLEEEIISLKKSLAENQGHDDMLRDLSQKYEVAVNKIASLEEELQSAMKLQETAKIIKADESSRKVLSALSDEEKIKRLEQELQKKRFELRKEGEKASAIKREHDLVLKSKIELQSKLEVLQGEAKPKFNKLLSSVVNKKNDGIIKGLEEKLALSNSKHQEAEGIIRLLKEEQQAAMEKIKELEASLVSSVDEIKKKYEKLNVEHEEYLINNHNLKIEDREITALKNDLQANQMMHERKMAAMTEDFERKYRAYSDKYAALKKSLESTTRQKDAIIKELEARSEQSNNLIGSNQQTINGAALEVNKVDAHAKRKIFDLQQQLQVARQECQQNAANYDAQITKLQEDYQLKLQALQKKLYSNMEAVQHVQQSPEVLEASHNKEKYARRIDLELFSIPAKLAMLTKVTSIEILPTACLRCSRTQSHLSMLEANCLEHSTWRRFQPDVNVIGCHGVHQDKQIRTDRFDLLTETRDVFVKLLQLPVTRETKELIKVCLDGAAKEIAEYMKLLMDKKAFLGFLHEELKTAGLGIAKEKKATDKDRDACEQCQLYKVCFGIVCALTERIKCSLVIIEGLENRLSPLPFCVDSAKGCDDKLEKLMIKLDELTSNVIKQKIELDQVKEKYKRAKRLADMRYKDVKMMEEVLNRENYVVNYKAEPIQIVKKHPVDFEVEDDNPRPCMGRLRDSGRKSLGATPKHFSPFFVTPDEHKEAKHEARRHK